MEYTRRVYDKTLDQEISERFKNLNNMLFESSSIYSRDLPPTKWITLKERMIEALIN